MATTRTNKNPFQNIVDEVDAEMVNNSPRQTRRVSDGQVDAKEMLKREQAQKTLAQVYTEQEKYPVRIAPSYAKYFGRKMRVTINSIAITIPCDGQVYQIPAEFACECERRMREMDAYELKSRKMADIAHNYEPDIGHLSFF